MTRIAALPVVANDIQAGSGGEVPTSEPVDGGDFQLDVPVASGLEDIVLVAEGNGDGVGVEDLVAFIELPAAGGESSAGWPLGEADGGALLTLGQLAGDSGTLLPETDGEQLRKQLGADATALLLNAQRDNYQKAAINRYFNRDLQVDVHFSYHYYSFGHLDQRLDTWRSPESVLAEWTSEYNVLIDPAPGAPFTILDLYEATVPVVLTPPAIVELSDGRSFGPTSPLENPDFGDPTLIPEENVGGGFTSTFITTPPEGFWYLTVGTVDGAYDFFLTSPVDDAGNFLFFFPILRVNTTGAPPAVESVALRWAYWDPASSTYAEIPESVGQPPIGASFTIGISATNPAETEDVLVDVVQSADGSYEPQATVYTTDPGGSANTFQTLDVSYTIGEIPITFSIWR